jgi:hypothetical protein
MRRVWALVAFALTAASGSDVTFATFEKLQ